MTRECCEIMEVENIAVLCHERLEGVYLEELRQEIMKVLKAVITQRGIAELKNAGRCYESKVTGITKGVRIKEGK